MGDVGRDREHATVAARDQGRAQRALASLHIHVCQEPAVSVPPLAPEPQPYPPAFGEPPVGRARALAEALDRLSRLHRLGSVDADVANGLRAVAETHARGIAVDHAHDPARRREAVRALAGVAAG
jgi:hypothetical protein